MLPLNYHESISELCLCKFDPLIVRVTGDILTSDMHMADKEVSAVTRTFESDITKGNH